MRSLMTSFGSVRAKTPLALPGMAIGLMGGSFNPPHEGHLAVAETALKRLALAQLWWIVSPGNPLKPHGGLPPLGERMAAARRLKRNPKIKVTGFEAALGGPYTAATIGFLRRRHPAVRFVWVMGGDSLATFDRWRAWDEIANTVPIAVVDRPQWRLKSICSKAARRFAGQRVDERAASRLAFMRPPAWVLLTTRLSGQSSTALRRIAGAETQPSRG